MFRNNPSMHGCILGREVLTLCDQQLPAVIKVLFAAPELCHNILKGLKRLSLGGRGGLGISTALAPSIKPVALHVRPREAGNETAGGLWFPNHPNTQRQLTTPKDQTLS